MKVYNQTRNTVIASKVTTADTVFSRLVGLLNRSNIEQDEGLIITQCRSIHMFFMRFPIDVVFVDKNNRIIGIVENIQPFHISPYFFKARYVLELPIGSIQKSKTVVGDVLSASTDFAV